MKKLKSYKQVRVNGAPVRLHRLVCAAKLGKSLDELGYVDHIDGDIHNNHPDNLREVTPHQNLLNSKTPKHNKTGTKGLSWDSSRNRWRCAVVMNNKQHSKRFKAEELDLAIAWLNSKRKELHGEYARQ
ncbi:TPA: HNH endonuclease [Vibrio parahaemolyticus]